MADLRVQFLGHTVPNPFLLASAPPTAFGENIMHSSGVNQRRDVLINSRPIGMRKDFGIIDHLPSGLSQYLDAKGSASPMDLVGKSLPWLTSHEALAKHAPVTATVDRDRCTACGACATACADSAYGALAMNMDGDAPRLEINRKRCDGCGLCTVVCKTGALTV